MYLLSPGFSDQPPLSEISQKPHQSLTGVTADHLNFAYPLHNNHRLFGVCPTVIDLF